MKRVYELTPLDGDAQITVRSAGNGDGALVVNVEGRYAGDDYQVAFILDATDLDELSAFSEAETAHD